MSFSFAEFDGWSDKLPAIKRHRSRAQYYSRYFAFLRAVCRSSMCRPKAAKFGERRACGNRMRAAMMLAGGFARRARRPSFFPSKGEGRKAGAASLVVLRPPQRAVA
jgi:hypothetical protein